MSYKVKLFYSYCHVDEKYREDMEKHLALLRDNSALEEWSDRRILGGQKIKEKVEKKIKEADIVVFLVSTEFLNSEACKEEWYLAKDLAIKSEKRLISIIIEDCAWGDFDEMKEYLAFPTDAKPLTHWGKEDKAWSSIYNGIKDVIEEIQNTFKLKREFREKISSIEFCSQSREKIMLEDLFVFPQLYTYEDSIEEQKPITSPEGIYNYKYVIIRGEDQSGKTKLCTHLFLDLVNKEKPAIFIDLNEIKSKKPGISVFEKQYYEQFSGDYKLWNQKEGKTIIFDNMSHDANSLKHVLYAKKLFDTIIVSVANDKYLAYFKDEARLSDFNVVHISPFSHSKQEKLIKKWLRLKDEDGKNQGGNAVVHGKIDQIENNINGIIINNKILPRYPFFILSILQTYEAFMPSETKITAYGHCYYVLIVAHLMRAGVERNDDDIDACFNFLSYLAFEIYQTRSDLTYLTKREFDRFRKKYQHEFLIKGSLINRLCDLSGILKISEDGNYYFSLDYSYYFFLGRSLAMSYDEDPSIIAKIVENSHIRKNSLSLIFAIHHAQGTNIIDDIILHTMCTIDQIEPSKLDEIETRIFERLLSSIPDKILSNEAVDTEREKEREVRDLQESAGNDEDDESPYDIVNQVYKSQKNMEILSQILKNKSSRLRKEKIEEIVETICDAGLRLVSVLLREEEEIEELTKYIEKKYEESDDFKGTDIEKRRYIKDLITYLIFVWTLVNIEKVASSLNKPELRDIIENVRNRIDTPAYDMIYYFYSLNTAESLSNKQVDTLKELVKKYDKNKMRFMHRVLSLRTQLYMNTHEIKAPIKQKISSVLRIPYKP